MYKLSTDELVELNSSLLKAVKEDLRQLKKYRYPVDPPSLQHRVGNEMNERVEKATIAWSSGSPAEAERQDLGKARSVSSEEPETEIVWEEATGQAAYQLLTGGFGERWPKLLDYKCIISSALLMYRLCCLFQCQVEVRGPWGYKSVWSIYLKHRSTNI